MVSAPVARLSLLLLGLLLVSQQANASQALPKELKRCYRSDKHINQCLMDAVKDAIPKVRHGLPQVHIPNLDPILLKRMEINKGQGSVALKISFKNMTIHNFFDGIVVEKATIDLDKYIIELGFTLARLTSKGQYEVKGRVMIFPVNGHGEFSTIMHEPVFSIKIIGKPVMHKDGKIYLGIEDAIVSQRPKRIVMHFENIINGDKRLSENFNRFVNDNWRVVFDEISPNLYKSLGDVVKIYLTEFFQEVPYNEIFPDHPPAPSATPALPPAAPAHAPAAEAKAP